MEKERHLESKRDELVRSKCTRKRGETCERKKQKKREEKRREEKGEGEGKRKERIGKRIGWIEKKKA